MAAPGSGCWPGAFGSLVLLAILASAPADPAGAQSTSPQKYVPFLGDGQSIFIPAITAGGSIPLTELGQRKLSEISVIVLANIPFSDIPQDVSSQLRDFVSGGGALFITGGKNSFGSGGYQALADLVPFRIRGPNDFVAKPFKTAVLLVPGHPAMAGGEFTTIGNFNDMNPEPGATEILQYPGGFVPNVEGGAATFKSPLMAEQRFGRGLVLGVAFNIPEVFSHSPEGQQLLAGIIRYLVSQSATPSHPSAGQP